jgi:hypothetical protein
MSRYGLVENYSNILARYLSEEQALNASSISKEDAMTKLKEIIHEYKTYPIFDDIKLDFTSVCKYANFRNSKKILRKLQENLPLVELQVQKEKSPLM